MKGHSICDLTAGQRTTRPGSGNPRPSWLTFTVDASCDYRAGVVGIGIVIQGTAKRKKRGPILGEHCEAYRGIPSGPMEEFAVLRALEIGLELGCRFVRVRSDCNTMRTRLKRDHRAGTGVERCDLHGAVLWLAGNFDEVKFAFVRRRKNGAAHRLARRAVREVDPRIGHPVFWAEGIQAEVCAGGAG